jgi:hypothetical protein
MRRQVGLDGKLTAQRVRQRQAPRQKMKLFGQAIDNGRVATFALVSVYRVSQDRGTYRRTVDAQLMSAAR